MSGNIINMINDIIDKPKIYIEEYQDATEEIVIENDLREVAKKVSTNVINEINTNVIESKEYVKKNKEQIIVDIIEGLILLIDVLNELVEKVAKIIYDSVMVEGDGNIVNYIMNTLTQIFDWILDLAAGKLEKQQLNKIYQVPKFWEVYLESGRNKELLKEYFKVVGVEREVEEIEIDDLYQILTEI